MICGTAVDASGRGWSGGRDPNAIVGGTHEGQWVARAGDRLRRAMSSSFLLSSDVRSAARSHLLPRPSNAKAHRDGPAGLVRAPPYSDRSTRQVCRTERRLRNPGRSGRSADPPHERRRRPVSDHRRRARTSRRRPSRPTTSPPRATRRISGRPGYRRASGATVLRARSLPGAKSTTNVHTNTETPHDFHRRRCR